MFSILYQDQPFSSWQELSVPSTNQPQSIATTSAVVLTEPIRKSPNICKYIIQFYF